MSLHVVCGRCAQSIQTLRGYVVPFTRCGVIIQGVDLFRTRTQNKYFFSRPDVELLAWLWSYRCPDGANKRGSGALLSIDSGRVVTRGWAQNALSTGIAKCISRRWRLQSIGPNPGSNCCYYPGFEIKIWSLLSLAGARTIRRPNFITQNSGYESIIFVGCEKIPIPALCTPLRPHLTHLTPSPVLNIGNSCQKFTP